MRTIHKLKEPKSLEEHRCKFNADYGNLPSLAMKELKRNLLKEQGHLCCYCMSGISAENMRVEHCKPQKKYDENELSYSNLLGACHGNEGRRYS